jgi:hypothetical protein
MRFSLILLVLSLVFQQEMQAGIISHKCLERQAVFGRTTTIFHGSSVEPTIAVNPRDKNHIVTAWQQDRISNGAALEIAISYSNTGGKSWHRSTIPLQICENGIIQRSGDSWLSFSSDGKRVYLISAVLNATKEPKTKNQFGVVVALSKDGGKSWSKPRFLVSSLEFLSDPMQQFANLDKTSITADLNNSKTAIGVWANFNPSASSHGNAQASITRDGGKHWTSPQIIYDPFPDLALHKASNGIYNDCQASNNVVVILPNKKGGLKTRSTSGDWLNFATRTYAKKGATDPEYTTDSFPFHFTLSDIVVCRSKDEGKHWNSEAKVVVPAYVNNLTFTGGYTYDNAGNITGHLGTLMRADQTLPSYNCNPKNGFLYVAFQTSEFRKDRLPQIGLVTSRDGGHTWSKPVKVSATPKHAKNPQAFSPFVAVTSDGRVGILYVDFRKDDKTNPDKTKMDAWLAIFQEVKKADGGSTKIGLDFVKEIRLSHSSYIAQNGPATTQGIMTSGDYQFLSTHGSDFYAIITKTFKGPFKPATTVFMDPVHNTTLLLDDNLRIAPFVSIIKNTKKGAKLVLTKRLKAKL